MCGGEQILRIIILEISYERHGKTMLPAFLAVITSSPGAGVATCYRRMDIHLANCTGSGGFDMHLYDRKSNTWVSVQLNVMR